MEWELVEVGPMDCTIDKSGIYTTISRGIRSREYGANGLMTRHIVVRVDIMETLDDSPIISFVGEAENVRKHVMRWIADNVLGVTIEHASYIGAEIHRASIEANYVQA